MQARVQHCRVVVGSATPPVQPEPLGPPGSGSPGQIVMSPRTPTDLPTSGFMFFVAGGPNPLGPINVWKRDPGSGFWALLATITGPDAVFFKWITVCSVNASELFFEYTEAPNTSVLLEEISGGGI